MNKATKGLVLRAVDYKESDKILTVLTKDYGKITISARGARKPKSKYTATSQLLAYSEFHFEERSGRYYLREGRAIELFAGLQQDITKLALGAYMVELLEAVSDADYMDAGLLSFGLNSLHMLSCGERDVRLVKAAFEIRLMCLAGYKPELEFCMKCRCAQMSEPMLHINGGGVHCKRCRADLQGLSLTLDSGSLQALRHIIHAPDEKIYAFRLGETGLAHLESAAEGYILAQLERNFRTLDFMKKLENIR